MDRRILGGVLAVGLALCVAQPVRAEGWYVGGFYAPEAMSEDIEFGTALGAVTTEFEGGSGWGLVFGRELGSWRFEAEWTQRESDVENHLLGGAALPGPTGTLDAQTLFVNGLYDFNRAGIVAPYLGVGLGWAEVELDGFGVAPVPAVLSDDDSGFAYQFIVGVGFNVGSTWNLFVDYRHFFADGLELTVTPGAGGVTSEIDFEVESIQAGARFRF